MSNGFVIQIVDDDTVLVMTAAHGLLFKSSEYGKVDHPSMAEEHIRNRHVMIRFLCADSRDTWYEATELKRFSDFSLEVPSRLDFLDFAVLAVHVPKADRKNMTHLVLPLPSSSNAITVARSPSLLLFWNEVGLFCGYDTKAAGIRTFSRQYNMIAEPGASGGPVFDDKADFVAWHVHEIADKRYGVHACYLSY